MIDEAGRVAIDACTLNNAFNAAQLALLVALVRWVGPDRRRR